MALSIQSPLIHAPPPPYYLVWVDLSEFNNPQ